MKVSLRLTFEVTRSPRREPAGERYRETDVYSAHENAGQPRMLGFVREDEIAWEGRS